MSTVSIIGTAGRTLKNKLTKELFFKMCHKAYDIIVNDFKLDPYSVTLVSGGAAWSDHVAIKLYKSKNTKGEKIFKKCIIYLPCKFTDNNKTNEAATYYHKLFSEKMGYNTIDDFKFDSSDIKDNGLIMGSCKGGFKKRNCYVANSKYLIAFTFGDNKPVDGGTLDTWNKCKNKKIHVNLYNL